MGIGKRRNFSQSNRRRTKIKLISTHRSRNSVHLLAKNIIMKKTFCLALFSTVLIMASQRLSAQAASNKIKTSLNHIAVYVVDLKKSTDFYRDVVQLDTIPEPFHDG